MKTRQISKSFKDLGHHEAQFRGAGCVANDDDDDWAFHIGDLAVLSEADRQGGSEFGRPGILAGCLSQQTL